MIGVDYGKGGAMALLVRARKTKRTPLGVRVSRVSDLAQFYRDEDGFIDTALVEQRMAYWCRSVKHWPIVAIEDFLVRFKTKAHIKSLRNHERLVLAAEREGLGPRIIPATKWKRWAKLIGKPKEASIEAAEKLLGFCAERHDQADAALIGAYAWENPE